ncbi:MAG: damage-control phosphatase ARMT1 family protein, partial [Brevefilum sp.]
YLMASEPGSFAQKTVKQRLPKILEQVISTTDFPLHINQKLQNFLVELIHGQVQLLAEESGDRDLWDRDLQPWMGNQWDQMPWLLAEAFFYRRILEITHYFQPGSRSGVDPFESLKTQEIQEGMYVFEDLYPEMITEDSIDCFKDHLIKALWGNRGDLSMLGTLDPDMQIQRHRIILDQSLPAHRYLSSHRPASIAYFFDNVGKELFFDLALIDYLLESNLASYVTCYVKPHPFFISDVMPKDLNKSINLLAAAQDPKVKKHSERLKKHIQAGRLIVAAPSFLTLGREFHEMPVKLQKQLELHNLTILKGDLNYRRLMRDRHWPPTTPVEAAGGYFPTPFLSLRTLKSELIVGLTVEGLEKVKNEGDPDWLTNGKRGIITFCQ